MMGRHRFALVRRAWLLVLALSLFVPLAARAQDATPEGEVITSKTRDELNAELQAAFAETDEPVGNPDGTYVVGDTNDLQSIQPFLVESDPSITVTQLIFDGLIGGDPRTGEPAPGGLSDFWEISPDRLTYTFHLSKTATWHDGVDVTADDVAFSFAALADPATASAYTGAFNDAVASWQVVDPDTIQVVAKETRFAFLYDLFGLYIVPKHIWESVPYDQWATDPGATGQDPSRIIGSGAFKFESWTQGQEIRLTRNDAYHDPTGVAKIKEYVFRIYPDSESLFNAFLAGDIDVIGLEPEQVASVDGVEGLQWDSWPERGFFYYEMNLAETGPGLFNDVPVRQALMYAIDRQSIVDNILLGFGEVAVGTHPSISPGYAPDQITTNYTYDPEKAKALLAEAGWTDTNGNGIVDKDGKELSFEFLYGAGSSSNDSIAAYLQEAWKAIGVEMTPRAMDFSALIEATTAHTEWQMALYGFSWDATFIQDVMFGCDKTPPVGFNDMYYCNPQVDALNDQANTEFDLEARRQILIQVANIVNDEQPIGIINFSVGIGAWSDRVHNYHPHAWSNRSYVGVWVDA